MFLNGIEAITSAVMSGIVVFRFDSLSQMRYQWQYLNFFITRLVAILSFFKEVYKANREHLEMRRIDAAVQSREETQANIESQAETHQEQKPSTTRECKSYKKSIVFFVLLLAVCATAVALGLLYDPPAEYHSPRPPPTCNATEYALDPKNQEFFLYYDVDSSGGLSFTEYDAYIDCLYEDTNSLPPKELCDNNGDGEIFFYEYKLCAEMTDIFMYSEDSENFYKFDMDNSGGLSPKEFQIYYLSIMSGDFAYQLPDDYLDIYFGGNSTAELTHNEYVYHPYTTLDLVDTDRDGLLSKQEFLLAFQWALQSYIKTPKSDDMYDEYFAEGDENADGKLSFEEWGTLLNFVIRDEDSNGKVSSQLCFAPFSIYGFSFSLMYFNPHLQYNHIHSSLETSLGVSFAILECILQSLIIIKIISFHTTSTLQWIAMIGQMKRKPMISCLMSTTVLTMIKMDSFPETS